MMKKEVLTRKKLEAIKQKEENRMISLVNDKLEEFHFALLKGQTVGININEVGKNGLSFIIDYFNESGYWIVQKPEDEENKKKEIILFTLK